MWYQYQADLLTIQLYIQPGSKSTEFAGFYDSIPKIRLSSPPIEGRANKELQKYIALMFQVPISKIKLVRGDKSRRKTILISGSIVKPEDIWKDCK